MRKLFVYSYSTPRQAGRAVVAWALERQKARFSWSTMRRYLYKYEEKRLLLGLAYLVDMGYCRFVHLGDKKKSNLYFVITMNEADIMDLLACSERKTYLWLERN